MDNVNYGPAALPEIVRSGVLAEDPFALIDVGCGMGLDSAWRLFEPHLRAWGFDPQIDECRRLTQLEANPNVSYHAAYVGTPLEPPAVDGATARYFEPASRSSGMRALELVAGRTSGRDELREHNAWQAQELSTETIGIDDFVRREGITSVDFVKVDTDGGDLAVLRSAEAAMEDAEILGFMVETPFTGTADPNANSFHNIDRFLRSRGYLLFTFSVQRYSRAVLPAPFRYEVLGSTTTGQTIWGDTIYLRDGGSPDYEAVFGHELSPPKLLKLAALYELFELPDCTVELLLRHRARLSPFIHVDRLVDSLTPPFGGTSMSNAAYRATFERDPYAFYPSFRDRIARTGVDVDVLSRSARRLLHRGRSEAVRALRRGAARLRELG